MENIDYRKIPEGPWSPDGVKKSFLENVSTLYYEEFYPQTTPYQAFAVRSGENIELFRESTFNSWTLKVIDIALNFFAWISGRQMTTPQLTDALKQKLAAAKINESISFQQEGREIQLRVVNPETPKVVPYQGTLYIENNNGDVGYLGKDVTCKFAEHIKLSDGTPFKADPQDTICKVCVTGLPFKLPSPSYFPISLFEGKKEGDRLLFFYDDLPIELTLTQMNHSKTCGQTQFETFLDSLKKIQNYKQQYLYERDVPDDMPILSYTPLTKNAKVFDHKSQTYIPYTQAHVNFFQEVFTTGEPFGEIQVPGDNPVFLAQEIKDINDLAILIDRRRLCIVGIPTRMIEFHKKNENIVFIKEGDEHKAQDKGLDVILPEDKTLTPGLPTRLRGCAEKIPEITKKIENSIKCTALPTYRFMDLEFVSDIDLTKIKVSFETGYLFIKLPESQQEKENGKI